MPHRNSATDCITEEKCSEILSSYYGKKVRILEAKLVKIENLTGYLGNYSKLSIRYHNEEMPKETKTSSFFVKSVPENNVNQNAFVQELKVFKKEALIYQNYVNPFLKLVSKRFAPQMVWYHPEKYIIFEDMSLQGYRNSPTYHLTTEKAVSAIKTLARFHAGSMIHEELETKKLGKIFRVGDIFQEIVSETTSSSSGDNLLEKTDAVSLVTVNDLLNLVASNEEKSELEAKYSVIASRFEVFFRPSDKFRNVCTHDDLWSTNIMFDNNSESVLVDFQLGKYCPPCLDVMMFLLLNLDREHYDSSKDTMFEIYYDTLCQELQNHELSSEETFPRTEFYESIEYYFLPALMRSVITGAFVFISDKLSKKILSDFGAFNEYLFINRSKYLIPEYHTNEVYKKRLNEVLLRLLDYVRNH